MHPRLFILAVGITMLAPALSAQETTPLPDKIATLKSSYEAAIARATTPITKTYVDAMQRLKIEYTKAGNLEAAVIADSILKQYAVAGDATPALGTEVLKLSEMSTNDFKVWLRKVVIVESTGEKTTFTYDGSTITSTRGPVAAPREHSNVQIETGKISVPFSTDLAVIRISETLDTATVNYDDEPTVDAKIVPKTKDR